MFKYKTFIIVGISVLFSACSVKEEVVVYSELKQKQIKQDNTIVIKKVEKKIPLKPKEQEFLNILREDKYSSLCGSKEKLQDFETLKYEQKSRLLENLFVEYVSNLANSCIDIEDFQNKLSLKTYKDRNQDYEIYKTKLDENRLIDEYKNENINLQSTLNKYVPKHPDFFKFIDTLNKNNLSKNEQERLKLNIERLKLHKYQGFDDFVQLNIPSTDFTFFEDRKVVKKFNTVVGEVESQTPILSSRLSYFVINPTWNIPDSIAKSTIIPRALKDKNYLKKKNIVIRKNYKLDSQKFKFKDIKWEKYLKDDVKYIPYKFIQLPSTKNGMGRLKFLFKNDHAVYMHDTIGSWRFKHKNQNLRFASHGCIRLEHPLGFMKHITKKYTKHSYGHTRGIYDKFETSGISLSKKLPVHLTYITSYVKNGKVGFYKDRYGYDKIQKLNF